MSSLVQPHYYDTMKILLVTERYWPEVGAAPSRLANMAEGLKLKGCEVDVLTSLPNYPKGEIFTDYKGSFFKKEIPNGVSLFRYWIYATVSHNPIARIFNMFSFAFMIWLFAFKVGKIKSYDRIIIQTPTLVVAASAMILFKKLYRKKCILNVSDIWPLTAVDMGAIKEGSWSFKFLSMLERFLYRNADGILGQSQEILDHISTFKSSNKFFLYRNLQYYDLSSSCKHKTQPLKVVFSGMLGVAQDVAGIVKNVPFKKLGVEFHIFGGGKQLEEIQSWISANPNSNVYAHGFVPKEEISQKLSEMDVSIVPLATRIRGAVPSKIYDTLPQGLPILFCGGGEGATFISSRNLGLVSEPGDYDALYKNIETFSKMLSSEYEEFSKRCFDVSRTELNFDRQLEDTVAFLRHEIE